MKVREALAKIRMIRIPQDALPVEETVAEELIEVQCREAAVERGSVREKKPEEGKFQIAVMAEAEGRELFPQNMDLAGDKEWVGFHIEPDGRGFLAGSKPSFLYLAFSYLVDNLLEKDISEIKYRFYPLAFSSEKSTFDLFLTQYARLIRGFKREPYLREYARLGFTHIEVNALAQNHPAEEGVPGEFYPEFYTYCPSLDQIDCSRLNLGVNAEQYL